MITTITHNPLFIQFSTILLLIYTGFLLRHYNFVSEKNLEFFNSFCLYIILPCFIISSFMTDLASSDFANGTNIFFWSLIVHTVFFILSYLLYNNHSDFTNDEKAILITSLPSGNISFFGTAVATLLYQNSGVFTANMYSIINRIFLNTVCLVIISEITLAKKDFIKLIKAPSIVASLIGATIFFSQNIVPNITIAEKTASILRIDHTLPFLFQPIKLIGNSLPSTVWLLVGMSITKTSLKLGIFSPIAHFFSIIKMIIFPILGVLLYFCMNYFFGFTIDTQFLPTTLLLLSVPVANTIMIFAFKYNKAKELCIACFINSTLYFLILLPIYYSLISKFIP